MEIDSLKMEALKKAYADIILNTAKEAAARIMVSERKALRFQQDLCSAKDDALFMIARLKQTMDSKISEAEIKSLSQQRTIEELEAQLHEAEEIIIDLRLELKEVQDELEKLEETLPLNERNLKEDVPSYGHKAHEVELKDSDSIRSSPSDSRPHIMTDDMKITPLMQEMPISCNTKHLDPLSDSHIKNNCPDNIELSSIIMRSKMSEQCRNGCTQRVRAFERTLLDGNLPPKHLKDQISPVKNELAIRDDEKREEACMSPSKAENVDMMKDPEIDKLIQLNSKIHENPLVKVIRRRKRKFRYGNAKKSSYRSRPHLIAKPCQPSSLPCCNSHSKILNNEVKPVGACTAPSPSVDLAKNYTRNEEILQHGNKGCEDQATKIIPGGYRKRRVKYRDTLAISLKSPPCQLTETYPPCLLSRCKKNSNSVNIVVTSGEDMLEMTENGDKTKLDLAISTSGAVQIAPELEKSVLVKKEVDSSKSSRFPGCTMNIEMVEVPLENPNLADTKASEANNGASSQADSDRLLKYTFHRKRKKASLSNPDETTPIEKNSLKRRVGEKQTGALEPNSSLIDESSRDSRRLVQVARQLISLSGKKWSK